MRYALLLLPLALLGACSGASGVAANGYPMLGPDDVTIYGGDAATPATYEVIGLIDVAEEARAQGSTRIVSARELEDLEQRVRQPEPTAIRARDARRFVDDARRDAGRLGANGLLLVSNAHLTADTRLLRIVPFQIGDDEFAFVAVYVGAPPEASGA